MTIRRIPDEGKEEPVAKPWPDMPEFTPQLSPEVVKMLRAMPPEHQAAAQAQAEIQSLGDQRFMWLVRQSEYSRQAQREHEQWHIDEQRREREGYRWWRNWGSKVVEYTIAGITAAGGLWLIHKLAGGSL